MHRSKSNPYDSASLYSKLTFAYMLKFIFNGYYYKAPTLDTIPSLPSHLATRVTNEDFMPYYLLEKQNHAERYVTITDMELWCNNAGFCILIALF